MSQEYNLHFIHGAKTKKNLSRSVVIVLNLFFLWTVLSSGWRHLQQKRHQQNWERVREQKDQMQISELNPSEKQHEIYVLWAIFQSGKPKGRVFPIPSAGRGSLTQMKAVNTSSYSIFLREINYAHDLMKLFLLLLIE